MKHNNEWTKVGIIGVDAGLCWIGDPCYILHKSKPAKSLGKNWLDFCDKLSEDKTTQFNYDLGHPGLGVCVSTGWGDGEYPVEVRYEEGRVAEVRVRFMFPDNEKEASDD